MGYVNDNCRKAEQMYYKRYVYCSCSTSSQWVALRDDARRVVDHGLPSVTALSWLSQCVSSLSYISTQLTKTCDLADEFQLTEIQREACRSRGNRNMKLCDPYVSTEQVSDSSATSYNLLRYCFKPYIFQLIKWLFSPLTSSSNLTVSNVN